MGVGYLAARYSRRLELCGYRAQLEERGHIIPARWLLGNHQVEGLTQDNADSYIVPIQQATDFALDDLEDIAQSDFLIAFTEPPRYGVSRGGRHWEFGFACGIRYARWPLNREPKIFLVGPLEHVFTALPIRVPGSHDPDALIDGRFPSWGLFLKALDAGEIDL